MTDESETRISCQVLVSFVCNVFTFQQLEWNKIKMDWNKMKMVGNENKKWELE